MRKSIINVNKQLVSESEQKWLQIDELARIEVTSEDPNFPIESAFSSAGPGWRAAEGGVQTIRIIFDKPMWLKRIRLEFHDTEKERTQEFVIRWSAEPPAHFTEMVRQQWNFGHESSNEIEDYQVEMRSASVLELELNPNISASDSVATLSRWQVA
jgi:hypothetical protein